MLILYIVFICNIAEQQNIPQIFKDQINTLNIKLFSYHHRTIQNHYKSPLPLFKSPNKSALFTLPPLTIPSKIPPSKIPTSTPFFNIISNSYHKFKNSILFPIQYPIPTPTQILKSLEKQSISTSYTQNKPYHTELYFLSISIYLSFF